MSEARRAQVFARDQALQDPFLGKGIASRKQLGDPLEQLLLVRHVDVQVDVVNP